MKYQVETRDLALQLRGSNERLSVYIAELFKFHLP